jgi:hypothetical protein
MSARVLGRLLRGQGTGLPGRFIILDSFGQRDVDSNSRRCGAIKNIPRVPRCPITFFEPLGRGLLFMADEMEYDAACWDSIGRPVAQPLERCPARSSSATPASNPTTIVLHAARS